MSTVAITDERATGDRRAALARRLLPALEELLEDESFIEISVERLVQRAGVSRSGFYLHYSDKGDLLQSLAVEVIADLFVCATGWWQLPPGASKAQLRQGLDQIVELYLPHNKLIAAIIEASSYDTEVAAQFTMLMREAANRVAEHVRRSQKSGDAQQDIDVEPVSEWITWLIERGLYQLVAQADKEEREKLMTAATDIIWRSLYVKGR
ncbi:TetR/AcrR family transcriptional regulator [Nocardia sp. R16R-3T]